MFNSQSISLEFSSEYVSQLMGKLRSQDGLPNYFCATASVDVRRHGGGGASFCHHDELLHRHIRKTVARITAANSRTH